MAIDAKTQLLERAGFRSGVGVLCAFLLILEFLPQNQRALLLKDEAQVLPKAFAAVVAPLDAGQSRLESGVLSNLAAASDGARRKRLGAGRVAAGQAGGQPNSPQVFADAGTAPFTPGVPIAPNPSLSDSGLPAGSAGQGGSASSGGLAVPGQPGPLGAGASTTSSTSGGATTSTSGGTTTSSGGVSTTSSTGGTSSAGGATTPVSSVPEPGTWLTMLVGFFMIGGVIRRKPRSMHIA